MNFRKLLYATLATASMMLAVSLPSQAVPDPLRCTGYPEPRVFLESQAYWEGTSSGKSGTDYGMVSEGTCFPVLQTLTRVVRFDVRVMMYENPGTLNIVRVFAFGSGGGTILAQQSNLKQKCAAEVCTYWYTLMADTTKFGHDGRQEFRFHAVVNTPDGKQMFPTTGWMAYLKNGKSVSNYRNSDNFLEARAWYTSEGYTTARVTTPLPTAPVSGVWTIGVKMTPGSGGHPVSEHFAIVDPCLTCDPEIFGTTLQQGAGPFQGNLSIDTRWLSNGPHQLLLRTDAPSTSGSTLSGLLVIPFVVRN